MASARDWARFGLLYLYGGSLDGSMLLPPGWVEQARTPTLDAGYGRGFWLNHTHAPHPLPGHWGMPQAPDDAYFGRGYLGQFVVIVPTSPIEGEEPRRGALAPQERNHAQTIVASLYRSPRRFFERTTVSNNS